MDYRWRCTDADGNEVTAPDAAPDPRFDTQEEAEDWLSASWPDLAAAGVSDVTLLDGDTEVYGPMSLQSPE
jgi:hypothetical protein